MKIILTLNLPESKLTEELCRIKMNRETFKEQVKEQLQHGMQADEICPGATCSVTTED